MSNSPLSVELCSLLQHRTTSRFTTQHLAMFTRRHWGDTCHQNWTMATPQLWITPLTPQYWANVTPQHWAMPPIPTMSNVQCSLPSTEIWLLPSTEPNGHNNTDQYTHIKQPYPQYRAESSPHSTGLFSHAYPHIPNYSIKSPILSIAQKPSTWACVWATFTLQRVSHDVQALRLSIGGRPTR